MRKIISSILLAFSGLITVAQGGDSIIVNLDTSAVNAPVIIKIEEPSLNVAKDYLIR